jgi:hypothetical protein
MGCIACWGLDRVAPDGASHLFSADSGYVTTRFLYNSSCSLVTEKHAESELCSLCRTRGEAPTMQLNQFWQFMAMSF